MDQIAADIANEGVAAVFGGISAAAVNGDTGRRSEEPGRREFGCRQPLRHLWISGTAAGADDAPRFGLTLAEYRSRAPFHCDAASHARHRQVGVPQQIVMRKDDLLDVIAVATDELVAPVVGRVPEL